MKDTLLFSNYKWYGVEKIDTDGAWATDEDGAEVFISNNDVEFVEENNIRMSLANFKKWKKFEKNE